MNKNLAGSRFLYSHSSLYPQADTYHPKYNQSKEISQQQRNRVRTSNYPISSLKSQLHTMKTEFAQIFGRGGQQQKQSQQSQNRYKSPSNSLHPRRSQYQQPSIPTLSQQNLSLKSSINHLQHRQTQYQNLIHNLYRTIQQLSQQLQTSQQSLMVCKLELENEMESIREQLRGKREEGISLEDYGEVVEINGNLKQEIQGYMKRIEGLEGELEKEYRKIGEMEREGRGIRERVGELEGKRDGCEREIKQKTIQINKLKKQNIQLKTINTTLSTQLHSPVPHPQHTQFQTQLTSLLQQLGQANAQCFLLRNNYQLLSQQHSHCHHNSPSPVQQQNNTQQIERFKDECIRQRDIIQDMTGFIRRLQDIKGRLEMDRQAMLSDIMYMEEELGRRGQEIGELRGRVAEREEQLREKRGMVVSNRQTVFEPKEQQVMQNNSSGTVFVPSQSVADEVMNDFDGLLNSPKPQNPSQVPPSFIAQVLSCFPQLQDQKPENTPKITHISDLKRYINGEQNSEELAVSIIVDENRLEVVEREMRGEEGRDQSMLMQENEENFRNQ